LSNPQLVAEMIRKHAPDAVLVVFETGPLATWFHRKLTAGGLPAACIDARHAKAAHTAPLDAIQERRCLVARLLQNFPFNSLRAGRFCAKRRASSPVRGRSNRDKRLRREVIPNFGLRLL
jgi:transposase